MVSFKWFSFYSVNSGLIWSFSVLFGWFTFYLNSILLVSVRLLRIEAVLELVPILLALVPICLVLVLFGGFGSIRWFPGQFGCFRLVRVD